MKRLEEVYVTDAYHSLSLYDARTNNYYTVNDRQYEGDEKRVRLVADDREAASGANPVETVLSPTRQGVALIRRLASPDSLLDSALEIRQQDSCWPVRDD